MARRRCAVCVVQPKTTYGQSVESCSHLCWLSSWFLLSFVTSGVRRPSSRANPCSIGALLLRLVIWNSSWGIIKGLELPKSVIDDIGVQKRFNSVLADRDVPSR